MPKSRSSNTEYMREYRKRAKSVVDRARRDSHLKKTYGISLAEYDEMLEEQGNGCAICGTSPEKNGRRLDVDHCHTTGKIRGLLCHSCNLGIGKFKDNPDLLAEELKYLYKSNVVSR